MPSLSEPTTTAENAKEETMSRSSTPTPSNPRGNPSASAKSAPKKPQKKQRTFPIGAYGVFIDMEEGIEYMTKNNLCSEDLDEWIIYRMYLELLESKFGIPVERLLYVWDPDTDTRRPLLVFKTDIDPPDVKVPDRETFLQICEFLGRRQKPQWYVINWPISNSALNEILSTRIEGYIVPLDEMLGLNRGE
ncbi:hypothetical protein CPC08DRAFT_704337 [Agrocybe pediades]|nr:hypothetical protein CPC08DRAFT_704337 [Agrocybe pediades]